MKCPSCGTEMENGHSLQYGVSGMIRVVKGTRSLASGQVEASACPDCGKVELHVDYTEIQ